MRSTLQRFVLYSSDDSIILTFAKVEKLRNAAKAWKDRYESFSARTREELTKRNSQIAQLETEKNQVAETARTTTSELEQLKTELSKTSTEGASSDPHIKALEEAKATLQASVNELTAKVASLEASAAATVPVPIESTAEQQTQVVCSLYHTHEPTLISHRLRFRPN